MIERADPEKLRDILLRLSKSNPLHRIALEKLTRQASIDPLTGLYNRNVWPVKFAEELKHTDESSRFLGCLLIDLDDFGQANKMYGQDFGDLLLSQLGNCLKRRMRHISEEPTTQKIRRIDILGRYGGDEFIIFAPQQYRNQEDAINGIKTVAEKILTIGEAVTTTAVLMRSSGKIPEKEITLSVGWALYRGEHSKSEPYYSQDCDYKRVGEHPLIRLANENLRRAKSQGKNRFICSGIENIV